MMNKMGRRFAILTIFATLTYAYLYPGSQALMDARTDVVMSDDTDPSTLPYYYDQLIRTAQEHPSRLFYGAVYLPVADPQNGIAYWVSWNERISVLLGSLFVNTEQLSTFFIGLMMIVSGLSMYALGRSLKWNHWIALGLGIAWAFSAYMRARAKVHGGFVGTYHLPLIFLGLNLIIQQRDRRSLIKAGAAFLAASTVGYYYILTTLFISPFFLAYLAIQKNFSTNWRILGQRLILALIPSLVFLGLSFTFLLPSDSPMNGRDALPKTGEAQGYDYHPFLNWFAAHPMDYLAGDISLSDDVSDWNPLREILNSDIVQNLQEGNTHERTNGIRWIVLALALTALVAALKSSIGFRRSTERQAVFFFALLMIFAFWLSLSPESPVTWLSPSFWLHSLFSQIRVPSRAGIIVHFCALVLSGFALEWLNQVYPRYKWISPLFAVLVIADYPPFYHQMPMAQMRAPFRQLQRSEGACGTGLYFPYVHPNYMSLPYYHFLQTMRGSDCHFLNALTNPDRVQWMLERFPPSMDFVNRLNQSPTTLLRIKRLAECVPLTFLVFDPVVPTEWSKAVCSELGWIWSEGRLCRASDHGHPLQRYPDECGY